jgi:hypothetical protein
MTLKALKQHLSYWAVKHADDALYEVRRLERELADIKTRLDQIRAQLDAASLRNQRLHRWSLTAARSKT